MIAQLIGILDSKELNHIIIDVNGVGYKVKVPTSLMSGLPKIGEKIKVYTYQVVREDAIELCGFLRKEERNLFSMLLLVSGIGPKMAMALMSGIKMEDLVIAITKGNVNMISTIPGIGTKTAQRLVIELKERIAKAYAISGSEIIKGLPTEDPMISDAVSALMALGYSPKEARDAVMRSGMDLSKTKNIEELIKNSLKSAVK